MKDNHFDAIVVGSGITGGWAAKELTEKGLKTLMLERGRNVEPGKDYVTEHKREPDFHFRGKGDRKRFQHDQPIQSITGQHNESTHHFFINDRDNPYTNDKDKPFVWIRGHQLGGRSLMWTRQTYRWTERDFNANAEDGLAEPWPINYKEIEPWYDYVEKFVGISGEANVSDELPHGQLLPPMELNAAEKKLRAGINQHFPERKLTVARQAVLTAPHNGRPPCHYCGTCARGCSAGSYFSTQSSTLPAAKRTGNLTLATNSIVHSIIFDESTDKATGVRVIDSETREVTEYFSKIVFLCASAFESVRLLFNSKTPRFSDGLGNSSGVLGHYIMDHNFGAGARGHVEGIDSRYFNGHRPCGIVIPRFRNVKSKHPDFVRGYQLGGQGRQLGWSRGSQQVGIGSELKQQLRDPGVWQMRLSGAGECLPRYENHVRINPDVTDAWGIPVLHFSADWSSNETAMRKDMISSAEEMLDAAGFTDIETYDTPVAPGQYIHEMGGARMGSDPKKSVLNAYNQCHDVPNLFITDGASMASSSNQNPSLTYMALTARAVNYAVNELRRGNI
ncbi:GMC oxidoreductase [Paraglaciecola arctica]|uniref:GMC oxidoreductase n=1 Tax=Paraglaciecola arctica TaxID=1128911 RepID=UPI001C07A54C|nr:GMC family oxidoreductase [Paraglaciecola arctica]MBU3004246.1 GMC family oxidoreductase [Paraglaciecola arctica]